MRDHHMEQTVIIAPGTYPAQTADGPQWITFDRPVMAQATFVDVFGLTYYQAWIAGVGLLRLRPEVCTSIASPSLN